MAIVAADINRLVRSVPLALPREDDRNTMVTARLVIELIRRPRCQPTALFSYVGPLCNLNFNGTVSLYHVYIWQYMYKDPTFSFS